MPPIAPRPSRLDTNDSARKIELLTDRALRAETELAKMREKARKAEAKLSLESQRTGLAKAAESVSRLRRERETLNSKISGMEAELEKLRDTLGTCTEALRMKEDEWLGKAGIGNNISASVGSSYGTATASLPNLTPDIQRALRQSLLFTLCATRHEADSLRTQLEESERQITSARNEIKLLQSEKEEAENQKLNAQKEKDNIAVDMEILKKELENALSEMESYQTKTASLTGNRDELKSRCTNAEMTVATLQKGKSLLEADLERATKNNEKLHEDLGQALQELKKLTLDNDQKERKIAGLSEELNKSRSETIEAQKELKKYMRGMDEYKERERQERERLLKDVEMRAKEETMKTINSSKESANDEKMRIKALQATLLAQIRKNAGLSSSLNSRGSSTNSVEDSGRQPLLTETNNRYLKQGIPSDNAPSVQITNTNIDTNNNNNNISSLTPNYQTQKMQSIPPNHSSSEEYPYMRSTASSIEDNRPNNISQGQNMLSYNDISEIELNTNQSVIPYNSQQQQQQNKPIYSSYTMLMRSSNNNTGPNGIDNGSINGRSFESSISLDSNIYPTGSSIVGGTEGTFINKSTNDQTINSIKDGYNIDSQISNSAINTTAMAKAGMNTASSFYNTNNNGIKGINSTNTTTTTTTAAAIREKLAQITRRSAGSITATKDIADKIYEPSIDIRSGESIISHDSNSVHIEGKSPTLYSLAHEI